MSTLIFTQQLYLCTFFLMLSGGIKLELLDNNEKPLLDLTPDFVLNSDSDKFVSTYLIPFFSYGDDKGLI